jgi:hypothetical protein
MADFRAFRAVYAAGYSVPDSIYMVGIKIAGEFVIASCDTTEIFALM